MLSALVLASVYTFAAEDTLRQAAESVSTQPEQVVEQVQTNSSEVSAESASLFKKVFEKMKGASCSAKSAVWNHKKLAIFSVTCVALGVAMAKTCPWFRNLVGLEDEQEEEPFNEQWFAEYPGEVSTAK